MFHTAKPFWIWRSRLPPIILPPQRYASLTGSIHRGALKARNRSERIGSYEKKTQRSDEPKSSGRSDRSERIGSYEKRNRRIDEPRRAPRPDRGERPSRDQAFRQTSDRSRSIREQHHDGRKKFSDTVAYGRPGRPDRSERLSSDQPFRHPKTTSRHARDQYRDDRTQSEDTLAHERPSRLDHGERRSPSQPFRHPTSSSRHTGDQQPENRRRFEDRERTGGVVDHEPSSHDKERVPRPTSIPLSIPRTSAASEFVYGFSAVKAALQAKRRRLYKLYVSEVSDEVVPREGRDDLLRTARETHVRVQTMREDGIRLLDKMSQGRPHNGYILEASEMPIWPVEALDQIPTVGEPFWFTPGHQSAEEIAITGTIPKLPGNAHRYPLVLLLDNILDPGNLGAIIRSAAFFGVDAVALVDHNLAPLSPVSLKASSGAAEFMPFLKVKRDIEFIKKSKQNGWHVVAAVPPGSRSSRRSASVESMERAAGLLAEGPCILLIGGEGTGLRPRLQKSADSVMGIQAAPSVKAEMGLDSLNASVAAALMIQNLVQKHNTRGKPSPVNGPATPEAAERVF